MRSRAISCLSVVSRDAVSKVRLTKEWGLWLVDTWDY